MVISLSCLCREAYAQSVSGKVIDSDTGKPVYGAYITVPGSDPPSGTTSDENGKFRLAAKTYGRINLKITYIGYEDLIINNILVTSGKESVIEAAVRQKIHTTSEVLVNGTSSLSSINTVSPVSTHILRTDDAMRYAGGFYDASRLVNSFAGVITSNNDYSNEIVIRGNSSRGLLWRLEGIEIPNPNHFSDGRGGSGGAFSAITSNVIEKFDFFTGAFPSEYGNAFSGVMDLILRKGNSEKHEVAFQSGMIGAELSAEGPITGKSSFLINSRFTNFNILSKMNLIDLGETNYAPRTKDLVVNIVLPSGKSGYFNIFGFYGASELGKIASRNITLWADLSDRWEEMQKQVTGVLGIKNTFSLKGSGTYVRTVLAYSYYSDTYNEGYLDSSLVRSDSYLYNYSYPSIRFSSLINHRINAGNVIRAGVDAGFLMARMSDMRLKDNGDYDRLVEPKGEAFLSQGFIEWKYRPGNKIELNSGLHFIQFSVNKQQSVEPRFGMSWKISPDVSIVAGAGFHSRTEALSEYYALVKKPDGTRSALNMDMDLPKAFHTIGGVELHFLNDFKFRSEMYLQRLYNIPIDAVPTTRYSSINSSESLPDSELQNSGLGFNRGIEITVEKPFTRNYYFLITASLFDSKYRASDNQWYDTYYNTGFVFNLLCGKDFVLGKEKRNIIGVNSKLMIRGGYRYTPVDISRSLKQKRIIYDRAVSYSSSLPDFTRMDAGISYRRNQPGYSWIIMLDVQNVPDHKNVLRRKFIFENGEVKTIDVKSLGIVPVLNLRIEF